MNKGAFFFVAVLIFACSPAYKNPQEVLQKYLDLGFERKIEDRYDLLSDRSKDMVNQSEYWQFIQEEDTLTVAKNEYLEVNEIILGSDFPNYKRYRLKSKKTLASGDSLIGIDYYSLIEQEGNWKMIWDKFLIREAQKKFTEALYDESIALCDLALQLNPFSADAYFYKGWSYLRDESIPLEEAGLKIQEAFGNAIALEPDVAKHYNSLSAYYSIIGATEKAIENSEKAIGFTLNDSEKSYIYANLVNEYFALGDTTRAQEVGLSAIMLNNSSAFNWYTYGVFRFNQGKYDEAISYFNEAFKRPEMENALQGDLNFYTAKALIEIDQKDAAERYISKAIELIPNDERLLELGYVPN